MFIFKPLRLLCLLAVFPLASLPAIAQQEKIDSLKRLLPSCTSDTQRIAYEIKIALAYRRYNIDSAFFYGEKALKGAKAANSVYHEAEAYDCIGRAHQKNSDFGKALEYYKLYLAAAQKSGDKMQVADAYHGIGTVYLYQGLYEKSLENYYKAIKYNEETGNKTWMANDYANIGIIQMRQKLYKEAIATYNKILKIYEELNDQSGIATCYKNIGVCYAEQKENDLALEYYFKSLKIEKELNKEDIAGAYTNIASVYVNMQKREEAEKYFNMAYDLVRDTEDSYSKVYCLRGLGEINLDRGENQKALSYFQETVKICEEAGMNYELMDSYESLSLAYAKLNDHKNAYRYERLKSALKDTIHNEQNTNAIVEMQTKYDTEKKEKELELQSEKLKNQDTEIENQKLINYFSAAGLLFVIVIVVIVIRNNKQKQRINTLLEVRNRDITDSINYAQRIQKAILPSVELRQEIFPESFLVFIPKDVVSGDFYWYGEKNGKKIVAAVDCTGHGVPGAFMSMMGYAFLNEIISERGITAPDQILNELRNLVIRTMKQTGASGEAKDGMDISLVSIDTINNTLECSGANNPLWICRKNKHDAMEVIAPEKRSIGYHLGKGLPFAKNVINIEQGDVIYLFTDGYADQFGGPKGKKFKYKPLQNLLLKMTDLPMNEREEVLNKTFMDWKGSLEQVDDVCVLGIKI